MDIIKSKGRYSLKSGAVIHVPRVSGNSDATIRAMFNGYIQFITHIITRHAIIEKTYDRRFGSSTWFRDGRNFINNSSSHERPSFNAVCRLDD